jgi:hypothetical protein
MSKTSDEEGHVFDGDGASVLLVEEGEHFLVGDEFGLVELLEDVVSFHMEFPNLLEKE